MPDTEKNQDKYPQPDTQKKGLVSLSSEFEKNGARLIDFRKCYQRLGNKDGLFKLTRPARPEWMSRELYDQMPKELVVRAVNPRAQARRLKQYQGKVA